MSIRVSHVTYSYRGRPQPALDDVSTEFLPGQVTLIAGASGCGKTTLARCINGLIPQSYTSGVLQGQITLFGLDNATMHLSQISQIVGTVLQDPEQQIIASQVMNEIAFGLENLGLPREEIVERIEEAVELLHITHLLKRDTFTLSGGEKQKVALAGVLAMQPKALLLDEPLALLDPEAGHEALQLLRELAELKIAVIIIEHRIEDVLSIQPEQCIYMSEGRVTYAGDAQGLMEAVDWREVKLPAPVVIRRVHDERNSVAAPVMKMPLPEPSADRQGVPLVELRHVNFRYHDGPEVLHDINLSIRHGDRVAVLGPNGAGKTTLVKHTIGLNRPTTGEVWVDGHNSREMSVAQIARTVGYVFQSPSHMLFARTVREELSFGPKNLGLAEQTVAAQVGLALAAVNLAGYEEIAPLAMSFGQQKRISIASILSMSPQLLVMDEPSAGQDYASYTHFMDDIVGTTAKRSFDAVLFITHDLDLAIVYANRVWLIDEGRLVAEGSTLDVLQDRQALERCHVRPTSLLVENLRVLPQSGRLLPAPALASVL